MKVQYYYDEERGRCCDRCGRDIKHIYVLTDEITGAEWLVGCECINKVVGISDFGLKQLKHDLKRISEKQAKLADMRSKTAEQLIEEANGDYGMIEMSTAEKNACNWEQTWRMRTVDEYREELAHTMWFLEARIRIETDELSKKYKNVKFKTAKGA
jgi:hypothetical protein